MHLLLRDAYAAEAKVPQLGDEMVTLPKHQHIFWLQVSVHHAARMQCSQAVTDVANQRRGDARCQVRPMSRFEEGSKIRVLL
jgi:hypothetical protein